jgi:hypothetical protein
MKVRSLVKLPQYRKFTYEPRYYDEVKEEIEGRVARIEKEFIAEQKNPQAAANFKREWESALHHRQEADKKSNIMQLLIIVLLVVGMGGWIMYGNIALYVATGLLGVYVVGKRFMNKVA